MDRETPSKPILKPQMGLFILAIKLAPLEELLAEKTPTYQARLALTYLQTRLALESPNTKYVITRNHSIEKFNTTVPERGSQ